MKTRSLSYWRYVHMLNKEKPMLRRYVFVVLTEAPKSGEAYDAQRAGLTVVVGVDAESAQRQVVPRRGQRVIYLGCTESISIRQVSRYGHIYGRTTDIEPMLRRMLVHELDEAHATANNETSPIGKKVTARQDIDILNSWAKNFDYPRDWYTNSKWHDNEDSV